jgi:predicted cupin superfamily sugar epimerase
MTEPTPAAIITALGLRPLPVEGGLWAQSWRDEHCTAIYYLLVAPEFSALHRLAHTEVFAHHAGAPVRMLLLRPDGGVDTPELGSDLCAGQRPQVVVPPGTWQGGRTLGAWSLLGTVVAPPYTDDIVEFGTGDALAGSYPTHAEEIHALCR